MTDIGNLWSNAILEHNKDEYFEAHELFEDIWLELDDRSEKDIIQTLAQADALAVHLETGNLAAAKRLMRQLPELSQTFPKEYRNINLVEFKLLINNPAGCKFQPGGTCTVIRPIIAR